MKIQLDQMSRADLEALRSDIEVELTRKAKEERQLALAEAEKAAAQYGFSLSELTGGAPAKARTKTTGAVKYRNPEDPTKTWSGRGRRPAWINALDAAGRLDEALV